LYLKLLLYQVNIIEAIEANDGRYGTGLGFNDKNGEFQFLWQQDFPRVYTNDDARCIWDTIDF